jgi:hypothetical protein
MSEKQLILHVGFHKSGTTALQESLFAQRKDLESARSPVPELEKNFDIFWSSIAHEDKERFEKEAFDHAQPFNQRFYLEKKETGGVLFSTIQRRMLLDYFEVREK